MWYAILGGAGIGIFFLVMRLTREQRVLRAIFSDVHLQHLADKLERSHDEDKRLSTFEGISVHWENLAQGQALVFRSKQSLVPAAMTFLLAFADELVADIQPEAAIHWDKGHFALIYTDAGPVTFVERDTAFLDAARERAADRIHSLVLSRGDLSPYL